MAVATISLLVLVLVVIIGVPILARVFKEAAGRNENTPGGEGDQEAGRDDKRGPGGK